MRAIDVFTPKGEPGVTYVDDHLVAKATRLRQDLSAGPCVVSLSGPSKSGKTVFIEKTLGRDNLIKVNGAGIKSAAALWLKVLAVIGTPIKTVETKAANSAATFGAKVEGGIPLLAKGEVSTAGTWGSNTSAATEAAVDYVALLIQELRGTKYIVFIDDFHYISTELQGEIAQQIKEGIEGGVQFVCAAVPHRSDDVLLGNSDLRGRAYKVDFEYWKHADLAKIGRNGFAALTLQVPNAMIDALADEAAGSPQLMQSLCLNLCFVAGHETRPDAAVAVPADQDLISTVCRRVAANNDYSSTVDAMKEGPKVRGKERKSYVLAGSNETVDVYPLILRSIAANPPQLTLKASVLMGRIQALCSGLTPGSGSVAGSCGQIASIANGSVVGVPIVEWDGERDILEVRDPYLLFFLRWGGWRSDAQSTAGA